MNDKANQFFNQFGFGRTEVSIHGFNSKELDYSIKTIQPISELHYHLNKCHAFRILKELSMVIRVSVLVFDA